MRELMDKGQVMTTEELKHIKRFISDFSLNMIIDYKKATNSDDEMITKVNKIDINDNILFYLHDFITTKFISIAGIEKNCFKLI